MKCAAFLSLVCSLLIIPVFGALAQTTSPGLGCIDTHAHLHARQGRPPDIRYDYDGAIRQTLKLMDKWNIDRILFMPPPYPYRHEAVEEITSVIPYLKKHPSRFGYLGGGGSLNVMIQEALQKGEVTGELEKRFEKKAVELVEAGVMGFGELQAEHFSLGPRHPYGSAPPDHPLFLMLADIAAKHNLPIDIHMEAIPKDMSLPAHLNSPPNPKLLHANIDAFKRLLAHNRQAKIIWSHAGWCNTGHRTAALTAELLAEHPNLYMNFKISPLDSLPGNNPLDSQGDRIKEEWLLVMQAFPDRFMIGTDQFYHAARVRPNRPLLDRLKQNRPRPLRSPHGDRQEVRPLISRRLMDRKSDGPADQSQGGGQVRDQIRDRLSSVTSQAPGPNSIDTTMKFLSLAPPDLAPKLARENARKIFHD